MHRLIPTTENPATVRVVDYRQDVDGILIRLHTSLFFILTFCNIHKQ